MSSPRYGEQLVSLEFPCAVGFFNRKYYLACHSSNAMEAEKHAAKCTVAGLFSVLWLSSIFVRFLFIFDEANLNESWVVVNGGYYDGDVGSRAPSRGRRWRPPGWG